LDLTVDDDDDDDHNANVNDTHNVIIINRKLMLSFYCNVEISDIERYNNNE